MQTLRRTINRRLEGDFVDNSRSRGRYRTLSEGSWRTIDITYIVDREGSLASRARRSTTTETAVREAGEARSWTGDRRTDREEPSTGERRTTMDRRFGRTL